MKYDDIATVIKSGNSYALRIPKVYADKNRLQLGNKIRLAPPLPLIRKTNHIELQKQLKEIQKLSIYKNIKDPVKWQREQRERSNQSNRTY